MGRPARAISFILFIFWLEVSWQAHVSHPAIHSNATVFSHVYTIKLAGEDTEIEGASPPPQEALGPPSSSRGGGLYEHTLEGPDQEHVVFTHRINLPPQACGCPPGTEDTQNLLRRLQALENEVRMLRDTCQAGGGCCPAGPSTQASTGQTDVRTLCSHHGSFDLSRCLCECEAGWGGPTCAEPLCPGGCGGPERGKCVSGRCQCRPGYAGPRCEEPPSCPDDCNDQGRCVDGRCTCFQGYVGPSCSEPACPADCRGHGQCVAGRCVCNPGYSGADCGARACPSNCNRRGECLSGRCVCEPGFTGPACGTRACPGDCSQRGRCLKGGVCACHDGYTGPDCGQLACPADCSGHGRCENGVCVCHDGYSGEDCSTEIPSIGVRVANRDETSFRLEWNHPDVSVDAYEIHVIPMQDRQEGESVRLSGTETVFERTGLKPGEEYRVTIRAEKGQRYGPPVTQTVRTRVAPPHGLQSSQVTENTLTLQWEPPTSRPDGYILSYVPLVSARPAHATKRIELPAAPERIRLEELEPNTRYRITLIARQSGESSRATSVIVSTTAPAPSQPVKHYSTPSPSSHLRPEARKPGSTPLFPSTGHEARKPGTAPLSPSSEPEARKPGTAPLSPSSEPEARKPGTAPLSPSSEPEARKPGTAPLSPSSEPEARKPGTKPHPGRTPFNTTSLSKELFLKKVTQNISDKLSPFKGTLLERLESYLRATNFPLQGNRTIESVARDIYFYLIYRKPKEIQVRVEERLIKETNHSFPKREFPIGEADSVYSDGYFRPEHPKPTVVASFSDGIEVSLNGVRGVSDSVVIRYRNIRNGEEGELVVPGNASTAYITGLAPGTTYQVEIHGVVKGHSSKSYSLITATAPDSTTTAKTQTIFIPTLSPEVLLKDLLVTDVSPNSFHVTWSAPPSSFLSFFLQYKDPKSSGLPREIRIPGTERSVNVVDLKPSTEYELELQGEKPNGVYDAPLTTRISTASLMEKPTAPLRLGELTANNAKPNSLDLSWTVEAGNFDSFIIQYRDAQGKAQALPVNGDLRSLHLHDLVPSHRYQINLYGVSGRKRLGPISTEAETAPAAEMEKPSLGQISVLEVTDKSARLAWDVATGTFDSFLIQYKDAEGKPKALPVDRDSREATVSKLVPSRKYKFNLYGLVGRKRLGPVSTETVTASVMSEKPDKKLTAPPSLGELFASNITTDTVRLSWSVPSGSFDSFLIQYKDAEGRPQVLPMEGDSREVVIPSLAPSRRYKFNLYGIANRKRLGPATTNVTTASLKEETSPEPVLADLSVTDATSNSAHLTWNVPTGNFDSFLFQYQDAEGNNQALPVNQDSREVTIPNLAPSQSYRFDLYGIFGTRRLGPLSADVVTAASQETKERTGETIPTQPTLEELVVSDVTSNSVRLSWTVLTGNFDSFLVQFRDSEGKLNSLPVDGESREVIVPNLTPSYGYKFNLFGVSGRKRSSPISIDATTALQKIKEPIAVKPSLGEFAASDVTTDSIRLSWTVPTGSFDSFLVQYKDAEGKPQTLPVEGGSYEVTVPSLAPSRRYKFTLYGISDHKRSRPISTDATTGSPVVEETDAVQPTLGELSASDITTDSIRLSWTVPTGSFDSFLVQYKDAEGKLQALPVEGGSREVTVPSLAPSRRYKFNLYGISGRKRSRPISTDATTDSQNVEKPDAVQPTLGELSSSDVTTDSVRLSWTVPTGSFDSFLVQYKDAEGKPQALPVEGGSREVTVPNLAPSRRYKFTLYGISDHKRSRPISTDATTEVLEEHGSVQPTLGELSSSDVTTDSIRLSWTVPTGNFDSFLVQYKDAEGKPQTLPVEGGSREVTVPSLAPSRRYKFTLYGISDHKRSSPLSTDATTEVLEEHGSVQPTLGELSSSDVTTDSIRLSWTVPTGNFDSFLVQYKDAEGKPQTLPVEGGSREVTVPSLAPSRRYKFTLYGISDHKRSRPISTDATTGSPVVEETDAVQPTLGELSASDITTDSVRLSWTVPTGSFDSFLVQYKDAEGKLQALPVEGGSREVTVPSLAPSRRYKFNLYGISGRKRSRPISTDATTATKVIEEPTLGELSASDVTTDSVHLSWTVPTGSFDSFLVQYKDAEGKPQTLPVEGGSYEVTVPSLAPSRRYKFTLYGISGRKRSRPISTDATTGSPVVEETDAVQPTLGELSASDITTDSVRLSWTVPTGSFDSFLVQYKDAEGKLQALPVEGGSREVTVPSLAPSRRYKFNLYGISGRKRSRPISTDATTDSQNVEKPDAVQPTLGELSSSDVTTDSVRLSWTVPTGSFDSFLVQYKDAEGKPQALPVEGGSREVTVPNLAPSRRYKFTLYGISDHKRSRPISIDATTAATATSPEVTTERVVTIQLSLDQLSVSDVTSNSVQLSWVVPMGNFDSFLVQYEDTQGKTQELPVDGDSRVLIIPDLEPSQRYQFNLYGVYGGRQYGPLSIEAVTAPVPASPEKAEVLAPQPNLGELSAFDISSNSLRLSWTVSTGSFDSFLVQYKDAEGKPQTLPVEGGSRDVIISNLMPSHRYKFNLFGISGHKRLGPLSIDAVTAPLMEKPNAPLRLGELTASNVKPNSLDLSWTVETGNFDSFIIQYRDAQGKAQALPVNGDLRSLHLHDLAPSHRYQINLYGVSGRKRLGPISTEAETAPPPTVPPTPPSLGELSISDVTSDSVRLSWTVPTGSFDSFQIQYKDAEGKPQALPVEGGSREVTIPNLAPSRRYKFNLYGVLGRKRLGPVSADTITVSSLQKPLIPPSLGELSASDVTSSSVRLSWSVLTGSFDSFLIQYKDAEGKPQAIPVEGTFREIVVPSLVPSRRYKFNLYGLTGRKRLGPVSTDAVTEQPSPPSLEQLSVSNVTSDSAHLSWTVGTGAFDSFLVQYKDAEGKPQSLPVDGSNHETSITGLSPSRRYKFNLYGMAGRKRVGPVSADTVTDPAAVAETEDPVKPSLGELSVSDVTSSSALLTWTVPTGSFDSFLVQYKDAEGKPQTLPVEGGSREVTVPSLAPSRRYKFNLFGVSGRKRVGPVSSEATTAETEKEEEDGGSEPSLGELSVSEASSDSVHLSWTVPTGNFDSFLIQYKDAEDEAQALPVDGGSHEVTVSNLSPSHQYRFDLYGLSGGKYFGPVSTNAFTVPSTPEQDAEEKGTTAPPLEPNLGELSVSDVSNNSVRLSWDVPAGTFDSFLVQYKDDKSRPQTVPVDKKTNSVVIYYLVPFYRYKFSLYGISGNTRFGPASVSIVTATTENEKEHLVKEETDQEVSTETELQLGELLVSEVTSDAARLSWSVPKGSFDSFSVQYKDAEGRPQALPVGGSAREVLVPSLFSSHKYRFNLYGISGQRRFGPISVNAVTTAAETPEQAGEEKKPEEASGKAVQPILGDVTVSEITPDSLLLSWSIQEGSFDSFLIQYKDATGKLQMLPVDGAMRSLHLYNLMPSHRYKFNVFGVSGYKRVGPISVDAVTAPQEEIPIQPSLGDLSVTKVTSDSVSLSWNVPVGNFDSFQVKYKDAEGIPQVLPLSGDSRDATVPSLAPSRRYKFNLYGIYGHKRLGPVSTDAITDPRTQADNKAQLKLGELSVHNITSESLLLSWSVESGNFDSFIIQYRDAGGKPHALPVDGSLRSLRLHDLASSHRYRFNLHGVSGRKRLGPIFTEAVTADSEELAPPQPSLGEISASNINSTSVHLSWTVQTGNFDSFIIQYRDAEGKPQALPIDTSSLDTVVSNLAPSRRYKFNLYGISGRKRYGPISTEAVTARMVEPKIRPTLGDLSVSEVTKESVRLSWTISAGKFDSFLVQYKDIQGKTQTVPVDADSRTVVISDLKPSHRYNFNLYGISGKKRLGPISIDAVTAFPDAPGGPANLLDHLVVSEVTPTTMQLTWEAPEREFDSFLVRYKDSLPGSGRSPLPAKEVKVPGDETTAVLRSLTPNTEYSLTVYGIKDGSEAANINGAARTTGLELDSPRDLRFSDIRETSVVANWRAPSSRIDRYKVSFQPSDGGEPRSISVDGSKLKTTIDNLTPGASYEVTVMSLRGFEESEPLVGYVTTVPDGPSDLRAINVTDSSAVLTWRPPVAEMSNYIVAYGPIGGPRVSESVPGNRVQLQLSELHLDTEYRASVYGEKEGNRSSPVSATFTTGADGPRDLHATEVSPRSARLTWSPPHVPPGGYLLSYETPYGQSKEIPLNASVTSYELQDLIPSSLYHVQVQALRGGMPTAPTSTSFTTGHLTYPFPRDCSEESQNGPGPSRVTTIYLGGNRDRPLQVYCDMETDGGGWIVFQRRMNGKTDFWRDWQDYAKGFGNLTEEFWLGNDALHQLTTSGDYELRVDLRAGKESVYATYQHFRVDSPADYYRLHLGSYSGTAGDAFSYHSGSVFSTRDRDPNRVIIPCAVSYRGAWWYRNCHYTNLNGLYANNRDHQGVNWFNWKGFEFSIPFTEMKLRQSGFQPLRRA